MADNWIQSFAVALGWDVDTSSLNTAKKSLADYEAAVKAAEKRIEDARWEGAKTEEEIAKLTRETNLKEAKQALADAQAKEKAEKEAAQKRQERNKAFISGVEKMALAAAAAATAIGYAVNRVAQSFDHLGFVSARTGASVQSLNSLGYAFKQVGGTSEQAVAAVESFTKALRENSGVKGFVQGLGVDMTKDKADQLLDTVRILQSHGYDAGSREAALAGISEENYNLLTRYIDQIDRYRAEYNKLTASLGVNSKEASDASMSFQRSLTRLQATASALGDKLMVSLAPALQRIVDRFQDWIRSNPEKVERVMNDISKALVWVAEKISALVETITGNSGDEFLKRWDAFVQRTERFAAAVERSVYGIEKLLKITGLLNREAVPGLGGLVTDYRNLGHRLFGGEGSSAGVPGTGAVGSFNPLQPGVAPADNRRWYEKILPKALGGKDAPTGAEAGANDGSYTGNDGRRAARGRMTAAGRENVASWTDFFRKPVDQGGMGYTEEQARGQIAMMQGESGLNLDPAAKGDKDWRGVPHAFGTVQWSDANGNQRFPDLKKLAAEMGKDWTDRSVQQEMYRREMMGAYRGVYDRIRASERGEQSLRHGIVGYENPRDHDLAFQIRAPFLNRLRQDATGGAQVAGNIPPVNGVGGLEQNQGSATYRRQALSAALQQQLIAAAKEVGVNVDAYSGGQDEDGPNRTGSHRHDHGNAADLRIYTLGPDGKRRYLDQRNDADRPTMEAFLRSAVKNGVTGIGAGPGYMGGSTNMHLGGGPVSAWGAGGSSAEAPDWVRRALEFGLEDRKRAATARNEAPTSQPAQRALNMTPGGFDPNRIDPHELMKPAAPLGANSVTNSTANDNRAVHQTFNTNTTIHEARNVREAGRMMEGTFGRMHALALENAQSATV